MLIEHRTIKTKDIYIVDHHHTALLAWANLRNKLKGAPMLLSFDHHTDTHDPFLHYCYYNNPNGKQEYSSSQAKALIQDIDYTNLATVKNAILKLRNDEHIKTALGANIILKSFIVSYNNSSDNPSSYQEKERIDNWQKIMLERIMCEAENEVDSSSLSRPFNYPESDIYIPSITFEKFNLSGEQVLDYAIETEFLTEKFNVFREMCPSLIGERGINEKYILDIDLDYFHTIKSIDPDNAALFYDLIRQSEIITVALERTCVELCKEYYGIDEDFDSQYLLERLLEHITRALD